MLKSTFIHIPGIGAATERALWSKGILDWYTLLEQLPHLPGGERRKREWAGWLQASISAWERCDPCFFASALPPREHWRCYLEFASKFLFLDIETTGVGESDYITLIGTYDGQTYRTYIHGLNMNMEAFEDDLLAYFGLVTFYGSGFDLPFIRRQFRFIKLPPLHIDLCFLMRRLGYRGGLKSVEAQLGISRSPETQGLSGMDAVLLWHSYHYYGNRGALNLLVKYNQEDVMNLKPLMEFAYNRMKERLWEGVGQGGKSAPIRCMC